MNKQELRKLYREKRNLLSREEVDQKSKAIAALFFKNVDNFLFRAIHIFLPITDKKEIHTWHIIEGIWNAYPEIQILIPKMEGDQLKTYVLNRDTILETNSWGIPEPQNAEAYDPLNIDLVLIPLLVFDLSGNRIGYGKGYYDKFLITCKKDVIKIGLSFFEAEEKIDAEPFDIPMNFCITPGRFYSFF